MSAQIDQYVTASKAAVDSLLAVANTALASAERIAALNLNTTRAAIEDTASSVKAVAGAKDAQAAAAVQASLAQPAIEKAVAYSRSVFEITTEAQQELAKVIEAQFGDFQKSVASLLEQVTKTAPAGYEDIFGAMKSAVESSNSAFGNMNTFAKQFADAAQASITAATQATATAAKKKSK